MEIKISKSGTLTKDEVEIIIKDYLSKQGLEVTDITFNIKEEEMEGDYFSEFPLISVFKGIKFNCK